jgi:hypothetical protein
MCKDSGHSSDSPKEVVIDGTHYCAVNVACIYSVSILLPSYHHVYISCRPWRQWGIAAEDVCIIEMTMWKVDVHGINNHEVTGIPIIMTGAIIQTQDGPIIVIMPQNAYLGHVKTIHSAAAQLNHYQNDVNDHSVKAQGGLQCILTLDGYPIPINIIGGLPYIKMRPIYDGCGMA